MDTSNNNGNFGRDDRKDQNQWEGREDQRLSSYDEGNESGNFDDERNRSASGENRDVSRELDRDTQFDNSYGMGSDSSRSLLMEGNEMVFENDRQGQRMDEEWQAARNEEEQTSSRDTDIENRDRSNQRYFNENDQRDQGL